MGYLHFLVCNFVETLLLGWRLIKQTFNNFKAMRAQEQKAQIKDIKELTKEITSSKEKARQYLKDSGISEFVKKATKEALTNTNRKNGK